MGKREKRILQSLGTALLKILGAVSCVLGATSMTGVAWHDLGQPAIAIPCILAGANALWGILGTSPVEEYRSTEGV